MRRNFEVRWRWTFANPSRDIVVRAMTRAVVASILTLVRQRNTTCHTTVIVLLLKFVIVTGLTTSINNNI